MPYKSDAQKAFAVEGAEVAILAPGGFHGPRLVGFSTIERVLKTQIVLANGRRFKASDHEEHGGSRYYCDYIVAKDDERVAYIEGEQERQEAENKAYKAVEEWNAGRHGRRNVAKINAAMEALENLRAVVLRTGE